MSTQARVERSAHTSETRHRIIVGVGDTAHASGPLLWACYEADRRHVTLQIVSARPAELAPPPARPAPHLGVPPDDVLRESLTKLTRKFCAGVDVDAPLVVPGHPARVLTEAVDEGTLMVVVGRRTHAGMEHALLGSTSSAVAGHSPAPVVVIPDRWVPSQTASAPLVVGLTGAGADERTLRFAFERASALHVPLIAVHSWRIPPLLSWSPSDVATARTRVSAGLDRLLAPWRADFPDVELVTATPAERPADAVLDAAHVAQLVVVGRHDRGGHHVGPRLGSTLRHVLHRAEIPVAVVPDGDVTDVVRPSTQDRSDAWAPMY